MTDTFVTGRETDSDTSGRAKTTANGCSERYRLWQLRSMVERIARTPVTDHDTSAENQQL